MKILSVSFTRDLHGGIIKQLQYEYDVAKEVEGVTNWKVVLLTCEKSNLPFAVRLPWVFRSLITRYIYCWFYIISNCRSFDYVINRHMSFDFIGMFVSWMVKNRITVHHAIEPIELLSIRSGIKGAIAAFIEKFTGHIILTNTKAIMSVTDDILQYQLGRIKISKPNHILPNGINFEKIGILEDTRKKDCFEAVFICQEFSKWQGLEKLIADVEGNPSLTDLNFKVNLIGNVSAEQKKRIENLKINNIFVIHGSLTEENYKVIMSRCHIGIASLALELEGLSQGSTLKVREMLAYGIPVYSNHNDVAIHDEFPFYKKVENISIREIYNYSKIFAEVDRDAVRVASQNLISKKQIIKGAVDFMTTIDTGILN